ncbi:MAG: YdcF family protein [Cyanobacteria bacterium P01_F01_bin.150]
MAVLWVLWLVSPKRRRRWLIQPLAVVVISLLLFTSDVFINLLTSGLTATLPTDSGDRVDTIVVLGRGEQARPERMAVAWSLWQEERASNIFLSGMLDAQAMAKVLKEEYGIPPAALAGEECSQTTEENALFTSAVLRDKGTKNILLVTDARHMLRSRSVFQSMGFEVVPHIIPPDLESLGKRERWRRLLREYVGMADYKLTGKLRMRSPEELDNPPQEIKSKLTEWKCINKVNRELAR